MNPPHPEQHAAAALFEQYPVGSLTWLREIAYQLALSNERRDSVPALPCTEPPTKKGKTL